MRQETVSRVSELRRALDSIGLEATTMRSIVAGLAARYSTALKQLGAARRRDPAVQIPRLLARIKGKKKTQAESTDLFLIENSIYFDRVWYLEEYPDVAADRVNPALHYLQHGAFENRDPGPWFSTSQYLLNNPDVAAAGANALLHYLYHGEQEGRPITAMPVVALPREQPAPVARDVLSCIFISGEPQSAGHRYRVMDFIEAASANDVAATWVRADELADRYPELAQHDIAVFWRVAWTEEVGAAMAVLRRSGCKILFDVDDLMTEPNLAQFSLIDGIRSQSLTEEMVHSHYVRVRQTMLEADACITTTEELAFYMRRAGKTTYVVTNGFTRQTHDLSRLSVRIRREGVADDLIRIGYAGGSKTHQRDFAMCVEGLAQMLREEPRCRLILFRTLNGPLVDPVEFPQLARVQSQIEWRDAVPLAELPREMARFDINLAPLEFGNPYCEAKSELKFFEAALVDVPTIASPTGPFRRAIDHGKTGFLAASADDWLVYLRRLVSDAALRSAMGRAAYRAALSRFGPETKALRFGNVIEQLRGGVAAARGFALDARLVNRRPSAPGVYPSETIFERDTLGSADVTVVVPLYNYEDFVEETLDSVSVQSAELLDLVIVDGHSTDGSLAVAQRWAERNADRFNRIVVLQNSANYGLGFCRNSGIDAAETRYIVLLDADNVLLPDACSELADHAKRTGAAFVYPTIQHFGASAVLSGNAPFEPQRLAAGNFIDAMALVSKEAWAMVGGIDHVQHGWEDYDFWCRIAELGLRGEWLSRPLAHYRVHAASMQTVQTKVPANYRQLLTVFKQRHPWVSLHDQEQSRRPPAPRETLVDAEGKSRLDTILPLLRCPATLQKLGFDAERTALHSLDGLHVWPVKAGRPLFTSDGLDVELRSDRHSTLFPTPALDLIRETKGWVLNMRAGGTAERFDNVVEAGYAISRHTDIVVDAHTLPFDDDVFDAAIILNAFEYYREPQRAAAELYRVLKPGAKLLIVTTLFHRPHEKPSHFYHCTRYGLEEWFAKFHTESLRVGDDLNPSFTMGWITSEIELALRAELGDGAADRFLQTRLDDLVGAFRDPALRDQAFWGDISRLSQPAQEIAAAGFEFIGRKGNGVPVYVK
jgi:GT2 family glycosyltransferase/glycosyltransferase involved in cell wall biosynthesis/SAM-dependent methyltransferase